MAQQIKFSVFTDFHYKKGMYPSTITDIKQIIRRAKEEEAEFVVSLGDMCNDYIRSPELLDAYLKNDQNLSVYGIYGNHELETLGNDMPMVTPLLTNRSNQVVWGTDSGEDTDPYIAYYYFDSGSFRFIFLDANYSLNVSTGEYEHYPPASWGAPAGNIFPCSLGNKQKDWLKKVIFDASKEEKHCIICSHPSFSGIWQECADAEWVRGVFREANELKKNTVILALNGHLHSNHNAVIEDVVYLDISAVRSGWWQSIPFYPYKEKDIDNPEYIFKFTEYDQGGRPAQSFWRPLSSLTMGNQSLFFNDPLSAMITVYDNGSVRVKGAKTDWMYNLSAPVENSDEYIKINDFVLDKEEV